MSFFTGHTPNSAMVYQSLIPWTKILMNTHSVLSPTMNIMIPIRVHGDKGFRATIILHQLKRAVGHSEPLGNISPIDSLKPSFHSILNRIPQPGFM